MSVQEINYQEEELKEKNSETLNTNQTPRVSNKEAQLSMFSTVRHEDASHIMKQDF